MFAFSTTTTGRTVKIYDRGDDWQIIMTEGGRTVGERWTTAWSANKAGSLVRAKEIAMQMAGEELTFNTCLSLASGMPVK